MAFLNLLQQYNGAVMAFLTFVYVVATVILVWATYRSVAEIRKTRVEQSQPYVLPCFEDRADGLLMLVVKNYGMSAAYDIRVELPAALVEATGGVFSKEARESLSQGGLVLAPQQSVSFALGGPGEFERLKVLGLVQAPVSCRGPFGRMSEVVSLNFAAFQNALVSKHDVPGVLWKIHRNMEKIEKRVGQLAVATGRLEHLAERVVDRLEGNPEE